MQQTHHKSGSGGHTEKPMFSVLIPCYNVEGFLDRCFLSVQHQSYASWEIVAVDDGSTDATWDMLTKWQGILGPQLTILRQENKGQAASRQAAFRRSSGTFITYLDADDMLMEDALETFLQVFAEYDCDLVQCVIEKCGKTSIDKFPAEVVCLGEPTLIPVEEYRRLVYATSAYNNLYGKAYRASVIRSSGDCASAKRIKWGEDLLQTIDILENVGSVGAINKTVYCYEYNPQSISFAYDPFRLETTSICHAELLNHAERWGDKKLVELCEIRLLRSVAGCLMNLSLSDFPYKKLYEEVRAIGECSLCKDGETLSKWKEFDGHPYWKFGLGCLHRRQYRIVTIAVLVRRWLKTPSAGR